MFQVGDIVKLKSGGPKMTVSKSLNQLGETSVSWFGVDGVPRSGSYPAQALTLVKQ